MLVACVLISHLPLKIELLRQPALKGKTVLIVDQSGTHKTVIDRSPAAIEIEVGMPLEKALSLRPDAALTEADMSLYRERWNSILDSLEQRSPVVEDVGLGLAYVDLHGLEELYGGEAGTIKAVLDAVPQIYYPAGGSSRREIPPPTPPRSRLSLLERCGRRKTPLLSCRRCP